MNIKKFFRFCYLILILLICAFIFIMSAKDGMASSEISGSFVQKIIHLFIKNFDNLSVIKQQELIESYQFFVRKSAHFLLFAALGFASLGFFNTYNLRKEISSIFSVGFVLFYSITDEIHQLLVPMRSGQVSDVLLDTLGGIFGVLIMNIFLILTLKIREVRNEVKE